jgi:phage FluMu protein Com
MAVKCPKCQAENKDGSGFCKKCGGWLEVKCPSCGSLCEQDSAFCNKCGHDLTGAEARAPLDYTKPQTYTPRFLADKILKDRSSLEGER